MMTERPQGQFVAKSSIGCGTAALSRIFPPPQQIDLASRAQCAASNDLRCDLKSHFSGGRNMRNYVVNENIRCYRKLIAMSADDPHRDEARHRMLLQLLAEEEAKHMKPDDWPNK
ncbi:hypothetical protein [Bradyrhizobium sp. 62B]|jgi:hypothetical protein|uniref:hypothetical protein n=1 Tax=Bradyrhizobium sp. 62B TaxID=2898442 RepID=UPI002557D079